MMADWKVTLSRPIISNGAQKTLTTDHVVEGTTSGLAVPVGIDEIFKREAESGYQLVPKECVDYWHQWRFTGGHLYEFQTEIEGKWGISFGINEIKDVTEPPPEPRQHRNGNHAPTPADELPDLNSMLQSHLKLLQDRNAVLGEELTRKQIEFDRNNADIMRISSMLTAPAPAVDLSLPPPSLPIATRAEVIADLENMDTFVPTRKRGRPPKVHHAE